MSGAPDWHGELLAPYVAESETVHAAYLEEPPEEDSRESQSTVATDSRLVRLSVESDEETITCVPYSQVTSAEVNVVDGEDEDPLAVVGGVLSVLIGLAALYPMASIDEPDVSVALLVLVVALVGLGAHLLEEGLDTEEGRVELALAGVDGGTAYSTTLPRERADFAKTVSRLVGAKH